MGALDTPIAHLVTEINNLDDVNTSLAGSGKDLGAVNTAITSCLSNLSSELNIVTYNVSYTPKQRQHLQTFLQNRITEITTVISNLGTGITDLDDILTDTEAIKASLDDIKIEFDVLNV